MKINMPRMKICVQTLPSGGNPSSSPDWNPFGNGCVKDRQVATRPRTTQVRIDNVVTAQVHHYNPEPRSRVLLSNANSEELKQSMFVLLVTCPRKKRVEHKKGGPFRAAIELRPWTGCTMEATQIVAPSRKHKRPRGASRQFSQTFQPR